MKVTTIHTRLDIVDVFEHNHFNHTHPHEELPEDGKEGEEQNSEESGGAKRDDNDEEGGGDNAKEGSTEKSSGEKTASGNPNTGSGVEEPCEDKTRGDDTRTPIKGAPDKK